jgi:SM-20-related protein
MTLADTDRRQRLDRMAQPQVLKQWLQAVEQRLAQNPADRGLMKYRAHLLRGLGELADAREAYAALAQDEEAARALGVLSGGPVTWTDGAGPVPFVRVEGFLDEGQLRRLWETATGPAADFAPGMVKNHEGYKLHPHQRVAEVLQDADPVKAWFLPLVEALVDSGTVLPRLGVAPFEVGRRELQMTRQAEGGFLWTHRDVGPANPHRRVTYIYYFHREPRRFGGGDLLLFDQTADKVRSDAVAFTRIDPTHNSLIVFPADRLHAVTRVTGIDDPLEGRWTVNGWLNAAP